MTTRVFNREGTWDRDGGEGGVKVRPGRRKGKVGRKGVLTGTLNIKAISPGEVKVHDRRQSAMAH